MQKHVRLALFLVYGNGMTCHFSRKIVAVNFKFYLFLLPNKMILRSSNKLFGKCAWKISWYILMIANILPQKIRIFPKNLYIIRFY